MNQLKAGAVLNYILILLNMLVGLLYTPYMLRMMGQSEFGLYSLVSSVVLYLTILDLGIGNAIIRYTAKYRTEGKLIEQYEMFGMFLVLYILLALVAIVLGMFLYFNIDQLFGTAMSTDEIYKARIMVILLIFNVAITLPMSVWSSIIKAYERFIFPKTINIIRIVLNTIVMIVLLKMGYKAIAMIVLQTIFNVLTFVTNYYYCKYKLQIKIYFKNFNWNFLREVAFYSFWIFLNVIVDRIYWSTGQFVLGAFIGTTAVAVFAVAIQLQQMYMNFSTSISGVFLPRITSMVTQSNDNREISNLFIKTGRIQYVVMAFILSGFVVFGYEFVILWAGIDYKNAFIIALLFFLGLTIPAIQNLGVTILQARNQMKFWSILNVVVAIVSLLFQIFVVRKYGAIGCALVISASLFVGQGLIINVYYKRKQGLDIFSFWKEILNMSIVPIVMCALFRFMISYFIIDTWFSFFKYVILFIVTYIPVFFHFSMNSYERNLFLAPFINLFRKIKIL